MTVRHNPEVFEAEAKAWATYKASVSRDYAGNRSVRRQIYIESSLRTQECGSAWLASYRERELHCRRVRGGN